MKNALPKLALLAALSSAACDNAPEPKPLPSFPDAVDEGEADAGTEDKPERKGPQYAVVSGDFKSTSVSLLGLDGDVLADDYINSGSVQPGLVSLLSGDVEMPTRSNDPGVLVLIDRFKTDVITRIRLSDAKVLGQVKTHTPPEPGDMSEYTSNPQDYIRISDDTAWITRNQPNLNPGVPEIDQGNDLLRIDPSRMQRSDERIDLSSLNGKGTRLNFDTGKQEEVDVYARPSRMVRVGETLVVGLGRSAFDFSGFGDGMVAVVDLNTHAVKGVSLPGLNACLEIKPIPGDEERVLVGCTGDFSDLRGTVGLAIVRVQKGKATVERTWRASEHADTPVLSGSIVALGGTLVAAAENNFSGEDPSVFGLLDLGDDSFRELASIPVGTGTFGTPYYDADTELLLVPDASQDADLRPTGGVRLFSRDGDDFEQTGLTEVAKETALPVRHVYPL